LFDDAVKECNDSQCPVPLKKPIYIYTPPQEHKFTLVGKINKYVHVHIFGGKMQAKGQRQGKRVLAARQGVAR
jgi:hypothetical protein